jgi:hypothetical protein
MGSGGGAGTGGGGVIVVGVTGTVSGGGPAGGAAPGSGAAGGAAGACAAARVGVSAMKPAIASMDIDNETRMPLSSFLCTIALLSFGGSWVAWPRIRAAEKQLKRASFETVEIVR